MRHAKLLSDTVLNFLYSLWGDPYASLFSVTFLNRVGNIEIQKWSGWMVRHLKPQLIRQVKLSLASHAEQVLSGSQQHRVDLSRSQVGFGHESYA